MCNRTRKKRGALYCWPILWWFEQNLSDSDSFEVAVKACLRISWQAIPRLGETTVPPLKKSAPLVHPTLNNLDLIGRLGDASTMLKVNLPCDKVRDKQGRSVFIPKEDPSIDAVDNFLRVHLKQNKIVASEHLFSYKNRKRMNVLMPMVKRAFLSRSNQALARAGIEPIHGHSIRRGGATQLLLWGVDPAVVKLAGGWVSDSFMDY